jgi:hypothetical protein
MGIRVGKVTHYFDRIGVAVVDLSGDLTTGDRICVLGRRTEFEQLVSSMEIDHQQISMGRPGMEIAIQLIEPVHPGDILFKLVGD